MPNSLLDQMVRPMFVLEGTMASMGSEGVFRYEYSLR